MSVIPKSCLSIVVCLVLCFVYADAQAGFAISCCASKSTCSECVQTPSCGWCSEKLNNADLDRKRCFQPASRHNCSKEYTYYPLSESQIVDGHQSDDIKISQIEPQFVKMALRRHESYSLIFKYTPTDSLLHNSAAVIRDNSTGSIRTKYYSKCWGEEEVETNTCNVAIGKTMVFRVEFELRECPRKATQQEETLSVYIVGVSDVMLLDVKMLCNCPCENERNTAEPAPECFNNGKLICGVCECDRNHMGRQCECSQDFFGNVRSCVIDDGMSLACSGRGQCICGHCMCNMSENPSERIYGDFCECDNYSCPRDHDGLLCSGDDHGVCECGKCRCLNSWDGPTCEISS